MQGKIPTKKWQRSLSGSKTAFKAGSKYLKHLSLGILLSQDKKQRAQEVLDQEIAKIIFDGLNLLKGTALKLAQQISLELDLFPEAIRHELEKSYNQVLPINRALARKIVTDALGHPPEEIFKSFETASFAAASLGQVHRAQTKDGQKLAIKIQYPGIRETIDNDIQLVKVIFKPLSDYDQILIALEEIRERLEEETNYIKEAKNLSFFKSNLKMEQIVIPDYFEAVSTDTILSLEFLEGLPLNEWLKTNPEKEMRNKIAQTLHDLFLKSLYELNYIHADPNPGNFIINDNLRVGLIDFGCVKSWSSNFIEEYRQMGRILISGNRDEYFHQLKRISAISPLIDSNIEKGIYSTAFEFGQWLNRICDREGFDFGENGDFIKQGRDIMFKMLRFRRHFEMNPDFIYLNRTRYGLYRLFEMMKAKVQIYNPYEF